MTLQPIGVIFPDVEMVLTSAIRDALGARSESYAQIVYVGNHMPVDPATLKSTRKDRMVIVRRDGGNSDGLRDRARVSVQVWAKTDPDATNLAQLVAALLRASADGAPVLKVEQQSGPTPIADPSGQPLRYLVFDIHTRGVPL